MGKQVKGVQTRMDGRAIENIKSNGAGIAWQSLGLGVWGRWVGLHMVWRLTCLVGFGGRTSDNW